MASKGLPKNKCSDVQSNNYGTFSGGNLLRPFQGLTKAVSGHRTLGRIVNYTDLMIRWYKFYQVKFQATAKKQQRFYKSVPQNSPETCEITNLGGSALF